MSESEHKGQRRVKVSMKLLEAVFTKGHAYNPIVPDDARLIRMFPSETDATYWFVFESSEWVPLDEAERIPEIDLSAEGV